MDFLADCAKGARKKFFSLNPVELCLDASCLPCLQDAMESSTLKLMFVYPLSALPTKLHGEHCAQAYDCFPFELLCEFALLVLDMCNASLILGACFAYKLAWRTLYSRL